MTLFDRARENMVECQIRPNKVTDVRILDAFRKIPRELFVLKPLAGVAYTDEEVAVGSGYHLMRPMILARMVQAANIRPTDIVLNIGCRTGYSSAILGALAATVVSTEQNADLVRTAETLLHDLDVCNAAVIFAPLAEGYPKQAPYDVIFVGGALPSVPLALLNQLSDGGRLVTILASKKAKGMGVVTVFTRNKNTFHENALFDAATSSMLGFSSQKEAFAF